MREESAMGAAEMIQSILDEFGLRGASYELLDSTNHLNAKIIVDSGSYFMNILASGTLVCEAVGAPGSFQDSHVEGVFH